MAFGRDVMGSRITGGCRSLSGTSVASPVVTGAVCLIASALPEATRWTAENREAGIINPASMKQAIIEGASRLPGVRSAEQGGGKLNVSASAEILKAYTPRASAFPAALNLTDCPYMWPACRRALHAGGAASMFNLTVLNGMGVTGAVSNATFTPADPGGALLDVRFEHGPVLWPWSGYVAVYVWVVPEGSAFTGPASGAIQFTVTSPPKAAGAPPQTSVVTVPLSASIAPSPPRSKRLLWDQRRSVRYPPAYLPRDSLEARGEGEEGRGWGVPSWSPSRPPARWRRRCPACGRGGAPGFPWG